MIKKLLWCGVFGFALTNATAQTTVTLTPEKDNSIYSESSNSNGLGKLFSGQTCTDDSRRALIQFDIAAMLPESAVITDVSLTLNVENVGPDGVSEDYSLHKVVTAWGEGASSGSGTGAPAIAPDATWADAMVGTDPWITVGGDFFPTPTATTTLADVGDYTWSSADMVTDVQDWLANPETNFGWILIGDETALCAARRFGSKDDGVTPQLEITYTCEGAPTAICQSINVYLDAAGEATILDSDLDGGSIAACGGELSFSASQTLFSCEDIFDGPTPPSLIISGVFDASLTGGTPKGVELYVVNDIEDLSLYGLGSANNGGGSDGEEFTFPAESASAGDHIYITANEAEFIEFFGFSADYISAAVNINGDDAIELFHEGAVTDIFGLIDLDGTGTEWDYMDGWAYRVSDTGPDGATFNIDNWTFSGVNALDGAATNADAGTPFPVGEFSTAPTLGTSVTLTVTDPEMDTDVCTTAIMVFDTLAPEVSCVGEISYTLDATGTLTIDPEDLDAGTTDGCGVATLALSQSTFTCADAGENEVQLYATDIYGNADSCTVLVTINAAEVISITENTLTNPTCVGATDGAVAIDVTGGTPDYIYDWDNDGTGDDDDTEDLTELEAGSYVIVVTDAEGCQSTATFELTDPEALVTDIVVTNASCENTTDGAVEVTTSEEELTFDWTKEGDAGFTADTEDLADLSEGTYTITVTSLEGCSEEYTVEVLAEETLDLTVTNEEGVLTANQEGATYQWIDCADNSEIEGETEQSFAPGGNGEFAVIITTAGGCTDTSACITVAYFGIDENNNNLFSIYPNPTQGQVNIAFVGQPQNTEVTVMDLSGAVVTRLTVNKTNTVIDLAKLENGIYFIQVKMDNQVKTEKVILKK